MNINALQNSFQAGYFGSNMPLIKGHLVTAQSGKADENNAAKIEISEDARKLHMQLRALNRENYRLSISPSEAVKSDKDSFIGDMKVIMEEYREQMYEMFPDLRNVELENKESTQATETNGMWQDSAAYEFPDGSMEQQLTKLLEGKVNNPSYFAMELMNGYNSWGSSNSTTESRAIERNATVKFAEQFAREHLNAADGQALMDIVNQRTTASLNYEKSGEVLFCSASGMQTLQISDYDKAKMVFFDVHDGTQLTKEMQEAFAYVWDLMTEAKVADKFVKYASGKFDERARNVQLMAEKMEETFGKINTGENFYTDMSNTLKGFGDAYADRWNKWTSKLLRQVL